MTRNLVLAGAAALAALTATFAFSTMSTAQQFQGVGPGHGAFMKGTKKGVAAQQSKGVGHKKGFAKKGFGHGKGGGWAK